MVDGGQGERQSHGMQLLQLQLCVKESRVGRVPNGEKKQNKLQEWGRNKDSFERMERREETCSVLETEPGI